MSDYAGVSLYSIIHIRTVCFIEILNSLAFRYIAFHYLLLTNLVPYTYVSYVISKFKLYVPKLPRLNRIRNMINFGIVLLGCFYF